MQGKILQFAVPQVNMPEATIRKFRIVQYEVEQNKRINC
jgi:hypothetical protein